MKMPKSLRGAVLVVAAMAVISGLRLPAEAAERLSASTQKLFDAVWSDNLTGVKASIARGADIDAVNELGVRPVDMAVDKGHFDIAHYLLSVERLSREYGAKARTQPPAAVPSSEVVRLPVSPVVAAPLPPEPAPNAVIAEMPVGALTTTAPPVAAQPTAKYWTPSAGDADRSQPALRVVSVAKPVKILAASPASSEKNVEVVIADPSAPTKLRDEGASRGVMSRVGKWFSLGSDKPEAVRDAGDQVAQEIVQIPEPEPFAAPPIAEAVIETPEAETRSAGAFDRITELFSPAPDKPSLLDAEMKDDKPSSEDGPAQVVEPVVEVAPKSPGVATETVSVAPEASASDLAAGSRGGVLDRVGELFSFGGKKDQATDLSTGTEISKAVAIAPEPTPAPERRPEPEAVAPPDAASLEANESSLENAETIVSSEANEGPGAFERLANFFGSRSAEPAAAVAKQLGELVAAEPSVSSPINPLEPAPNEASIEETTDQTAAERSVPPTVASENAEQTPGVFDRLAKVFERRAGEEQPDQTPALAPEAPSSEPTIEPSLSVSTEPEQTISQETTVEESDKSTAAERSVPPTVASENAEQTSGLFDRLAKVFERRGGEEKPDQTQALAPEAPPSEPIKEPSHFVPTEPAQIFSPPKEISAQETPALRVLSVAEPVETPVAKPVANKADVAEAVEPEPAAASAEMSGEPLKAVPEVAPGTGSGVIDRVGSWLAKKLNTKSSEKTEGAGGEAVSGNTQEIEQAVVKPVETEKIVAPLRGEKRVVRPAYPVETASRRAEVAALITVAPLDGVMLLFDETKRLGATLAENDPRRERCVDKRGWDVVFCIEPAFWPKDLVPRFDVQSVFYRGNQVIVSYNGGRVDQYHALFASHEFDAVAAFYRERYGAPTETPEIWTALIGRPKRRNPTHRWISRDPGSGDETILEIRQTDDLRWSSPPDLEHGMVRLYRRGARSVFELLTSTDLMLANIRGLSR